MANGPPIAPDVQYAALQQRVTGIENAISGISSQLTTLASEFRGKAQTQWPVIWSAIGVSFAVLAAVGALAYKPVLSNQERIEDAFVRLSEASLPRENFTDFKNTYENNRVVSRNEYIDKFAAVSNRIDKIDAATVPREEHDRVWRAYDQRFEDQQRQINEVKAAQTAVYNQRDVIQDILSRLDRAEHRVNP